MPFTTFWASKIDFKIGTDLFFSHKNQQNTHKLQNLFINIPIRTTAITIITVLIILEQWHIETTTGNVPNVSLHSKSLVEHHETDHNDSKVKC